MKTLNAHHWAFIALALGMLAYAGHQAAVRMRPNADLYAPEKQPAPEAGDMLANLAFSVTPDGFSRTCQPHEHHAGYTYTPHRYPRTVGGEITSVIHRGFSTMRIPNTADVQWIISPPSEVAW